jgi:type I restriction enzyme S subunit
MWNFPIKILAEVCELIVDCEHKTAPTQAKGYPSIRTPNIGRGRLILDGVNRVSEETYKKWTQRATPCANDLVLAREAPIGNVAIIPRNLKVCLGQRTVLIRPDKEKIDPYYLLCLLLGDELQSRILSLSNGATVHHLNMADIRNLSLPTLPPLPTQRKIAAILSAYDDLIENNTRRIAILEEMAQSLYREWFVHFRFPGHEKKRLVESTLGLIPEGWEVVKLGDIAGINASSIKKGYEPIEINYVDIASVSTGQIDNIETIAFADAPGRARRIVKHGDIIWSAVRPNRRSYSVILDPPANLIVSTGFAVISANQVPYTYLYYALTTDDFVNYLTNHATGAAYPAVNSGDFHNALVLLPSNALLVAFHNIVVNLLVQKQNLFRRNSNLRKTRDLLLPKLISGEVDVERLEVDTKAVTV